MREERGVRGVRISQLNKIDLIRVQIRGGSSPLFSSTSRVQVSKFLSGLSPLPKVLLSLARTNFEPTEYMKLYEKCGLSNLFQVGFQTNQDSKFSHCH